MIVAVHIPFRLHSIIRRLSVVADPGLRSGSAKFASGFRRSKLLIPAILRIAFSAAPPRLSARSTNLLVDGVAQSGGMAPFGMFEITGGRGPSWHLAGHDLFCRHWLAAAPAQPGHAGRACCPDQKGALSRRKFPHSPSDSGSYRAPPVRDCFSAQRGFLDHRHRAPRGGSLMAPWQAGHCAAVDRIRFLRSPVSENCSA